MQRKHVLYHWSLVREDGPWKLMDDESCHIYESDEIVHIPDMGELTAKDAALKAMTKRTKIIDIDEDEAEQLISIAASAYEDEEPPEPPTADEILNFLCEMDGSTDSDELIELMCYVRRGERYTASPELSTRMRARSTHLVTTARHVVGLVDLGDL